MSNRDAQPNDSDEPKNQPLFELVDIHGRITLDHVYQNDLHALKRLHLRNLSDQRILVKMRSNLRNQLAFQLNNENVANIPDEELQALATNTAAWSHSELSHIYPCNQLFNHVNYIDQLELEPRQTLAFVLAFLCESPTEDEEEGNRRSIDEQEEEHHHRFFNITGSLFFFGYRLDTMSALEDQSQYDALITSSLAEYQLSVKFRASICRSLLWTDVTDTGLNLDDCVLGEVYNKEFIVKNRSEIELFWTLNTTDLSNLGRDDWLFLSSQDDSPLVRQSIPSFGEQRVKVTFIPKEVGEFNYDLQLENMNDERNVIQTRIHATVRSARHRESLVISSGNTIDFGDCISGQWATQQIVLNNVSETPVEVRFLPEGEEIIFDIKSSLDESEESNTSNNNNDTKRILMDRKFGRESAGRSSISTLSATAISTERSTSPSLVSSRASSPTQMATGTHNTEPEALSSPTSDVPARLRKLTMEGEDTFEDLFGDPISDSSSSSSETDVARHASTSNFTRIEDLVLKPGKSRTVQVSFRPRKDVSVNDFNAGQFIRRNFRIVLEYGPYRSVDPKERKAIQCRARTCTSFVEAIPKEINFGDTDVGTLKSLPVNIFNRSDITARVELKFSSKVLNCLRGEITIPPRSYMELKLDLYPRKVNPCYRKEITLVNFLNHDNDQIIEVQSTNIDKNRVTFHSLFYRILTATGANFLDFGAIALNSPSMRTFTIENIRDKPLRLGITASIPNDIAIYTKRKRNGKDLEEASPVSETALLQKTENQVDLRESISNRRISSTSSASSQGKSDSSNPKEPLFSTQQMFSQRSSPQRSSPQRSSPQRSSSTAYLDLAVEPTSSRLNQRRRLTGHASLDKALDGHKKGKHYRNGRATQETSQSHRDVDTYASRNSMTEGKSPSRPDSFDEGLDGRKRRTMGITAPRAKSRKNLDWSDIAGKSRVPFEDLISVLEHGSKTQAPLFSKQLAEEQFVRTQLAWRQELASLVDKGDLVPTSLVNLDPHGEEEVVIVYTPDGNTKPNIQNAPKKQDARILLRLIDFDRNIDQAEFENLLDLDYAQIPLREVIVRAQLCRSIMDLGQRNINFGVVDRNERHEKSIVLQNRSETPLFYAIRKSGSIASGDIDLGVGRYGVVRPFGKREIDFVFEPTLPGPFAERLIIENIRDRKNDQVLMLKAMVRKPSPFFIKSLELSFGPCLVDQSCPHSESIVLTNTKKQSRLFEIRVDPNEVNFGPYCGEFDFVVEDEVNVLTKESEEEIEHLEQKLKIAQRKGQPEKVKKYIKKLAKLRNPNKNEDDENQVDSSSNGQPSTSADAKKPEEESESTNDNTWKENPIIFKKTNESVVFPLDALATKVITVHLKVVHRPTPLGVVMDGVETQLKPTMPIQGRIFVQEYKNSDVCKSVQYTATLCQDATAFATALASSEVGNDVVSQVQQDSPIAEKTVSAAVDTLDTKLSECLILERSFFDGGMVEVGRRTIFYARVSNESDEPLGYKFVIAPEEKDFFICPGMLSPLEPRETRKIMFEILPQTLGKQQHTLSLRNCRTGSIQHFTIQCFVHISQYLDFPTLSEDKGELDLGYSYIDPDSKYSQVTPLLVENVSNQDLYITCQSNLLHQVLIFMDNTGEKGIVEKMPCLRGSSTTVWVAVQPSTLTGHGSTKEDCRELVGGIKFLVYVKDNSPNDEADDLVHVLTQTVKFTSVIGQSHLEVSHRVINLGYTDRLNAHIHGTFSIKNLSRLLPLDYKVECPTGNIILDRQGGTLSGSQLRQPFTEADENDTNIKDGEEEHSAKGDNELSMERKGSLNDAGHQALIYFRILSYKFGLLNEKLIITNLCNSREVFEIEVRFFVDCQRLKISSLPQYPTVNTAVVSDSDEELDTQARPFPLVQWESVYVCPHTQTSGTEARLGKSPEPQTPQLSVVQMPEEDEDRFYVREIEVKNVSDQPMQLIAFSDVDITAGWVGNVDKVDNIHVLRQDGQLLQRSGRLNLEPGESVRGRLHCASPEKLDDKKRCQALNGNNCSLNGMLVLYDARQQVEMMALELCALYCVSIGELAKDRIDLGEVGHKTSWKPKKFTFTLRNLADVPLYYEIQCPKFLSFSPTDIEENQEHRYAIEPCSTQTVEGMLDLRRTKTIASGQHRFDVLIANQRNKNNTMKLRLRTMVTAFELSFDRLMQGELVLPTLYHPIMPPNVTCDNWFEIRNTSDDDIRFEIGADVSADLLGIVKLDVLSRYTNSPLKGGVTLGPQSKMEIRVRVTPNETSRLPVDQSDLLDPNGMILANLWVTTRPAMDNDDVVKEASMYEEIPVRCCIEAARVFVLGERRLDFKLITYYRESEEETAKAVCIPQQSPLTIENLGKVPLRFKVTVEGPDSFAAKDMVVISPLQEGGTVVVAAGETFLLSVAIANPKDSLPGQFNIHVDDLDGVGESARQTATIYLDEIVWDL